MTLYFISGLGADKRVFQKLKFPDHYVIQHIDWIAPLKDESLPGYARRLSSVINADEPFSLIGLSFGGMLSVEIAKILDPRNVILLSSASSRNELPWYYKLAGKFYLQKLVPYKLLTTPSSFAHWIFDMKTASEKKLLDDIMRDTDVHFVRWATSAILNWQNNLRPGTIFHIHGTSDKILPIRFVKCDANIKGGGHLMVLTHADQVSQILLKRIEKLS